jgi:hypothetical protein
MAIDYNNSSYHLTTTTPVTAVPLTMACWFNADSNTIVDSLMSIADSATDSEMWRLAVSGTSTVRVGAKAAGLNTYVSTTATFSAAVWNHACATFETTELRNIYLNGENKISGSQLRATTGLDRIGIALTCGLTITELFSGLIAEAAIWNVALTDAEVAQLGKGYSPLLVRPDGLVFYAPLVRNVQDVIGGLTLTATGSPTVVAHPRIIYPARKRFSFPTAAAAAPVFVPVPMHGRVHRIPAFHK